MIKTTIISDWHGNFELLSIPESDLICVCGDMLRNNNIYKYEKWLAALPAEYVFVIPGNHDIPLKKETWQPSIRPDKVLNPIIEPITYKGVKFGGFCWSIGDVDLAYTWAFTTYERERLKERMNKVPACDVLISHCPPSCREMLIQSDIDIGVPNMIDWALNNNCQKIFCGHVHEHGGEHFNVAGIDIYNAACGMFTIDLKEKQS